MAESASPRRLDRGRIRGIATTRRVLDCGGNSLVEGLVIAVLVGGLAVAAGYEYDGLSRFLKRWALAIIVVTTLFWGGAAVGAVARNAMCQGFWICE